MQKLIQYWGTEYDWSKCEAQLKALPHFVTEIDGLDIHFIHVKSKHQGALPVIITHGWPGSVIELLKIIDPFTNPTAHGGTEADAFDVVIPSMPGYGFSGKPTETGWDPARIARAWIVLMKRLGYDRYVAQGGDWGALITEQMALLAPPELVAIHTNMPGTIPPEIVKALASGSPPPADLGPDEKRAYEQVAFFYKYGLGYANEMALRPQTLYGIVDSPAGLAAWILDHDADSYALIARSFDGEPEGLTRDDILDNITFYWLTNTAISSARLYWEHRQTAKAGFFDAKGVTIPVGVSAYPSEIYTAPKSWTERAFPKLLHYGRTDKGLPFRRMGTAEVSSPMRCAQHSRRCGREGWARVRRQTHRPPPGDYPRSETAMNASSRRLPQRLGVPGRRLSTYERVGDRRLRRIALITLDVRRTMLFKGYDQNARGNRPSSPPVFGCCGHDRGRLPSHPDRLCSRTIRHHKSGRRARDQAGREHIIRFAEEDRCRPPECWIC